MPPRMRSRISKVQKENIDTENKVKSSKRTIKVTRKVLAEKTNSGPNDTSLEIPTKSKIRYNPVAETKNYVRPHRNRRLPRKLAENATLTNLSKKDNAPAAESPVKYATPTNTDTKSRTQQTVLDTTPLKTQSEAENTLVVNRPRRICRLPSRFDDHSISPSKFIPLQPTSASTPIQQSKVKVLPCKHDIVNKETEHIRKKTSIILPTRSAKTVAINKIKTHGNSPDTNNNAKNNFLNTKKTTSLSPKKGIRQKNVVRKDASSKEAIIIIPEVRVLGCNKKSPKAGGKNPDVYDFTFDPDEEPQPQKKKRNKPTVKRAPKVSKPKIPRIHKSAYDQNISKALAALKAIVKVPKIAQPSNLPQIEEKSDCEVEPIQPDNNVTDNAIPIEQHNADMNDPFKTPAYSHNNPSIRIEDIAADMEASIDHDLNYSPVNSPHSMHSTTYQIHNPRNDPKSPVCNTDPLNLQADISFFDDIPVASSSMNTSVRHPLASPWRVEFNNLPIKWPINTYVKPNMTPAVERSFIWLEDSNKKKHVYTNIATEDNEPLPVESNPVSLKQPSIISFIKEVVERKAQMRRGKYMSPTKGISKQVEQETHRMDPISDCSFTLKVPNNNEVLSNAKEMTKESRKTRKRKNDENICETAKSPHKQKTKDLTYFGFDESDNQDQENVSPDNPRVMSKRSLRQRQRAALQEINGPTRPALPVAAKSKITTSAEAVNKVYEGLKSAADAPLFPENVEVNTDLIDPTFNDDSQSVHLFEDIQVVHHLKPTRKSYGNNKKVTFRQRSASPSNVLNNLGHNNDSSYDDDFGDLTFEVPNIKEKKKANKKKSKKLMSKKEEKAAEEWAAGFNSMCEEIEEFPLVVE